MNDRMQSAIVSNDNMDILKVASEARPDIAWLDELFSIDPLHKEKHIVKKQSKTLEQTQLHAIFNDLTDEAHHQPAVWLEKHVSADAVRQHEAMFAKWMKIFNYPHTHALIADVLGHTGEAWFKYGYMNDRHQRREKRGFVDEDDLYPSLRELTNWEHMFTSVITQVLKRYRVKFMRLEARLKDRGQFSEKINEQRITTSFSHYLENKLTKGRMKIDVIRQLQRVRAQGHQVVNEKRFHDVMHKLEQQEHDEEDAHERRRVSLKKQVPVNMKSRQKEATPATMKPVYVLSSRESRSYKQREKNNNILEDPSAGLSDEYTSSLVDVNGKSIVEQETQLLPADAETCAVDLTKEWTSFEELAHELHREMDTSCKEKTLSASLMDIASRIRNTQQRWRPQFQHNDPTSVYLKNASEDVVPRIQPNEFVPSHLILSPSLAVHEFEDVEIKLRPQPVMLTLGYVPTQKSGDLLALSLPFLGLQNKEEEVLSHGRGSKVLHVHDANVFGVGKNSIQLLNGDVAHVPTHTDAEDHDLMKRVETQWRPDLDSALHKYTADAALYTAAQAKDWYHMEQKHNKQHKAASVLLPRRTVKRTTNKHKLGNSKYAYLYQGSRNIHQPIQDVITTTSTVAAFSAPTSPMREALKPAPASLAEGKTTFVKAKPNQPRPQSAVAVASRMMRPNGLLTAKIFASKAAKHERHVTDVRTQLQELFHILHEQYGVDEDYLNTLASRYVSAEQTRSGEFTDFFTEFAETLQLLEQHKHMQTALAAKHVSLKSTHSGETVNSSNENKKKKNQKNDKKKKGMKSHHRPNQDKQTVTLWDGGGVHVRPSVHRRFTVVDKQVARGIRHAQTQKKKKNVAVNGNDAGSSDPTMMSFAQRMTQQKEMQRLEGLFQQTTEALQSKLSIMSEKFHEDLREGGIEIPILATQPFDTLLAQIYNDNGIDHDAQGADVADVGIVAAESSEAHTTKAHGFKSSFNTLLVKSLDHKSVPENIYMVRNQTPQTSIEQPVWSSQGLAFASQPTQFVTESAIKNPASFLFDLDPVILKTSLEQLFLPKNKKEHTNSTPSMSETLTSSAIMQYNARLNRMRPQSARMSAEIHARQASLIEKQRVHTDMMTSAPFIEYKPSITPFLKPTTDWSLVKVPANPQTARQLSRKIRIRPPKKHSNEFRQSSHLQEVRQEFDRQRLEHLLSATKKQTSTKKKIMI